MGRRCHEWCQIKSKANVLLLLITFLLHINAFVYLPWINVCTICGFLSPFLCFYGGVSPAGSHVIHNVLPAGSYLLVASYDWLACGTRLRNAQTCMTVNYNRQLEAELSVRVCARLRCCQIMYSWLPAGDRLSVPGRQYRTFFLPVDAFTTKSVTLLFGKEYLTLLYDASCTWLCTLVIIL